MSKSRSLPSALKALIASPTYPSRPSSVGAHTLPAGRAPSPLPAPRTERLAELFGGIAGEAKSRGVGWGEWMSVATATLLTLNSPSSLVALHRMAVGSGTFQTSPAGVPMLNLAERVDRACLMREVGLKCIGFIGIPKVINNLAALRGAVDEDKELASALPKEPRRHLTPEMLGDVHRAANELWDDIYNPHSAKLLQILGRSHPDLPVFIVEGEYGPLFSNPPFSPTEGTEEPIWSVNRLRTSLVAVSSLRAQGGVAPQVTSHIWGLLKAVDSIRPGEVDEQGKRWLTTQEGAAWVIRIVDGICAVVEGAEPHEREEGEGGGGDGGARGRRSKL